MALRRIYGFMARIPNSRLLKRKSSFYFRERENNCQISLKVILYDSQK